MSYRMKRVLEVLLLLLAAAAIIYFAVRSWNNSRARTAEAGTQTDSAETAELTAITYNNGTVTLSFLKNGEDAWYWAEHEDYPLDTSYVDTVAAAITGIAPTTTIKSGEGEELDAYGLDSPSATVEATASDGTVLSLSLGNATDDGSYYMKYAEDDTVYVIDAALHDGIALGIYDMYALETLPSLTTDNISTVTLEGEKTSIYTVVTAEDDTKAWYKGSASAEEDENVQAMAEELSSLRFSSCVVWNPVKKSIALCGLSEPQLTVTVAYTDDNGRDAEMKLRIGSAKDDDSYYVLWNDSTTIYSMSKDSVSALLALAAL